MSRSIFGMLSRRFGREQIEISRREVLRTTLLAASAGLLAGCATGGEGPRTQAGAGKRVIIVGAGLAGLACGCELGGMGYWVNVFEARGRVGGRVLTLEDFVPGKTVEAGGEFISAAHPTWAAYRDRFKLQFVDAAEKDNLPRPLMIDGKRLDENDARAVWDQMRQLYGELAKEAAGIDVDEPWNAPDAEKMDRRSAADWIAASSASAACKRMMTADLEARHSVPASRQSYLALLAQVKAGGGENYWAATDAYRCKGGSRELAMRLGREIGIGRIKLRAPVVAVQARPNVVLISTADGKAYEAEDVVLATPPGAWAKMQIYPGLPDVTYQVGPAVKYLSAVKGPFWKSAGVSAWSESTGDVGRTWDATAGQGEGAAGFTAYSAGPAAQAVRSYRLSDRERMCMEAIERMYPGFERQLARAQFMDWAADPWTLGGSSFPSPGRLTRFGPVEQKLQGRIHLAGEHMCAKYAGTMEGALHSGVLLARRMAARDGAATASVL